MTDYDMHQLSHGFSEKSTGERLTITRTAICPLIVINLLKNIIYLKKPKTSKRPLAEEISHHCQQGKRRGAHI